MRDADPLTEHVVAMELEHLKKEVSAEFAAKMDLDGCIEWLLSRKTDVNRNASKTK
jgi:hypothetical protein